MKRLVAKIIKKGPLTNKEAEVLRLLCEGYYRPEIALKLHRTLSTVSSHTEHIAEKLQARGSTEIVVIAEKLGLVEIKIAPYSVTFKTFAVAFLIISQLLVPVPKRRPPRPPTPTVRLSRQQHIQ